jgi:hypothetical protein
LSFSWLTEAVAEFTAAFKGVFWHDTWAMAIPPLPAPFDLLYTPSKEFKTLIIGLTFGDVKVFDAGTGAWRDPTSNEYANKLPKIGIFHRCGEWMDWHWDPLVHSLGVDGRFVYPQLGFASVTKPYELRVVNKTDLTVFTDATFWVIRFPNEVDCPIWAPEGKTTCDVEEIFWRFMRSKVLNQLAVGKAFWENLKTYADVKNFVEKFRSFIQQGK